MKFTNSKKHLQALLLKMWPASSMMLARNSVAQAPGLLHEDLQFLKIVRWFTRSLKFEKLPEIVHHKTGDAAESHDKVLKVEGKRATQIYRTPG